MVTAAKKATQELDGLVIKGINAAQAEYEQEYQALVLEMVLTDTLETKKIRDILIATGRPIDDLKRHLAIGQARYAASKRLETEIEPHRAAIAEIKPALALAIQGRDEMVEGYRRAALAADTAIREMQILESTHQQEIDRIRTDSCHTLYSTRSKKIEAETLRLSAEQSGIESELKELRRLLRKFDEAPEPPVMGLPSFHIQRAERDKPSLNEALRNKTKAENRIAFLMQSDTPTPAAKAEFERKLEKAQADLAEAEEIIAEVGGLEARILACQERLQAVRVEIAAVNESANVWTNFDFD